MQDRLNLHITYYWRITDDIYLIKYIESDDSESKGTKFS